MTPLTTIELKTPYLILIGEENDETYAKTGLGIVHWQREKVAGQYRFPGCRIDLGVPDLGIEDAAAAGVGSLLIGVAPVGGTIPAPWWDVMIEAAAAGLDIVSGLHIRLGDNPELAASAQASGARLVDVRVPPVGLPVGNGRKRSGKRLLTVGTDCVVGKKFTALALTGALRSAGLAATFRASGQTGIMIAGQGIPIDAVVSDFVSGAAECLSPDNDPNHWDVIEGQGALLHPGYAAVSLGLLHGSQPDAIVVCHDAARTTLSGWEHYPVPAIEECIELNLTFGRLTNPAIRCVGVSVNTSALSENKRLRYLSDLQRRTGLPCFDPLQDGFDDVIERLAGL